MLLTKQVIIKRSDEYYEMLDGFCIKAKNLYNKVLYELREIYYEYDTRTKYEKLDKRFREEKQKEYKEMPMAHSAQGTLKQVFEAWDSFWAALEAYWKDRSKFTGRPELPRYLKKGRRSVLFLTNQNVKVVDKVLTFPKVFDGFTIPLNFEYGKIKQVRIVPRNRHFVVEIVYEIEGAELKPDNERYLGIDLGVNNFAAIVSNDGQQPILINGKGLKSINQYWNKRMAHLQSEYENRTKNGKTKISKPTKQQITLTNKRNRRMKDFYHKASKYVVKQALERECNTIVVGNNKWWKQNCNMGKVNNQNFVQIAHGMFIDMLKYKCEKYGLNLIVREESYTSDASFLDNDKIPTAKKKSKNSKNSKPSKKPQFSGKRVRGLYKAKNGIIIHADVNAAFNILRKAFPEIDFKGRGAYGMPTRVTLSDLEKFLGTVKNSVF